jgi:hypothetical protein
MPQPASKFNLPGLSDSRGKSISLGKNAKCAKWESLRRVGQYARRWKAVEAGGGLVEMGKASQLLDSPFPTNLLG